MLKAGFSPSLMCADPLRLGEDVAALRAAGADYFHMDVMDGRFVPNLTLGTEVCRAVKNAGGVPLDIHLMTQAPERKLDWFPIGPGDIVSVHCESTAHLHKALARIRALGGLPFAAINPGTPVSAIEAVTDVIAGVLVMTVDPGFAGQKMYPGAPEKIARVREALDRAGRADARIEADGNVSPENARKMRAAGADLFVLGTAGLFQPGVSFEAALARLRAAAAEGERDRARSASNRQ